MRYSKLFGKTVKDAPKDEVATNAKLLIRGGFIDKEMAGVYSFLPLGLRVLSKIEQIIREEMNKVGQEVLLPAISPKSLWETTGRLETIDVLFKLVGANKPSRLKNDSEYILNCTHEDIITPIVQKFNVSYRDLPTSLYQIQTKFRNEPRAKSGLLRGREFRMKDLYSFHATQKDLKDFYENIKPIYMNVYKRMGLGDITYEVAASGGDITKDYSHEFQVRCEAGEDVVYYHPKTKKAFNKEIMPKNTDGYEVFNASEVGNIFPLNTKFSDAFSYTYTDEQGKQQPVYMGSYGIGSSRLMGVIVEVFHDDRGIMWPEEVAPFDYHLISLGKDMEEKAQKLIKIIEDKGKTVLWDDRKDISAGEKFADCDLVGIPKRLVVSKSTGDKVEVKKRDEKEIHLVSTNNF